MTLGVNPELVLDISSQAAWVDEYRAGPELLSGDRYPHPGRRPGQVISRARLPPDPSSSSGARRIGRCRSA